MEGRHTKKISKEADMASKILITRTVPPDKAREMLNLLREMRSLATSQSGYISGETLKSDDRPDVYLVISTWNSMEEWRQLAVNSERESVQAQIDALLGQPTEYEVYSSE